jgi:Sec-independent protein secretion pathway component TatC
MRMNDKQHVVSDNALRRAWVVLILLTLSSAFIAESVDPTAGIVILVCLVVAIKGQLVVDRLMGLRHAPPLIRGMMLAYFYVLPILIALALIFPEPLRRLTTL